MVTRPGPLCKVKLLKKKADKAVVRSPEKAGVGGSTPSLATIFNSLRIIPFDRRGLLKTPACHTLEVSSERGAESLHQLAYSLA
jgi:hypothetical protein